MYDGGDIAMHFDIRFRYGDSVNTVVRNHCQGGSWGQEERGVSYFPFMPSANFDILILCEAQAFKVGAGATPVIHLFNLLPAGRHRHPVRGPGFHGGCRCRPTPDIPLFNILLAG